MDYFRILNLQREPFSNSPEPDFFFQSDQHRGCLQKLELAVRLRRGLNVVLGEVGTGKTTLCRRLILNFSRREEDGKQVETHLILDPSFSNAREFLSAVSLLFGLSAPAKEESEWQFKENIKNYLFARGIDEGKTVVLIIDEGQKLPAFCLEILREFLNYETNEYKLLQIVIFAQKEFEQVLQKHANFADRVNQYYFLKPLTFRDSRAMIRFRIAKASSGEAPSPAIFTLPALWAIYRATGGYPRKIIALCHQAMLAMIIQNRVKAGYSLVRSCAGRVSPAEAARWPRWVLIIAVAVFLLALIAIFYRPMGVVTFLHVQTAKEKTGIAAAPETLPPIATPAVPAVSAALPEKEEKKTAPEYPALLGQLTVKSNDCVLWMLERIYGKNAVFQLENIAGANPQIRDLDRVKKGDIIKIPARPRETNPLPKGKYWVQIASFSNLKAAYELVTESYKATRFFLLSYWNEQNGLTFVILLKEGYPDEAAALSAMKELPAPFASGARVVSRWSKDTVFF